MPLYNQGIILPRDILNERTDSVYSYLFASFINRFPFFFSLERRRVSGVKYKILNYNARQRTFFLKTAIAATTDPYTTFDVAATSGGAADVTPFQVGDVLEILDPAPKREVVRVTAINSATTLTVRRAQADSTVQNPLAANSPIILWGNAGTGGEVDRQASRVTRASTVQYVQHSHYAVQTSDVVQAAAGVLNLPAGITNPHEGDKDVKWFEMLEDIAYSTYYSIGTDPDTTDNPTTKGFRELIVTNRVTAPTSPGSYTFKSFLTQLITPCIAGGGRPNLVVMSTDFIGGLHTWGVVGQARMTGTTALNIGFNRMVIPLDGQDVQFMHDPKLKPGTAAAFTMGPDDNPEVAIGFLIDPHYKPRGSRGSAEEGDILTSWAPWLQNETHHSWVENITGFA
jgi:hypothetical protein